MIWSYNNGNNNYSNNIPLCNGASLLIYLFRLVPVRNEKNEISHVNTSQQAQDALTYPVSGSNCFIKDSTYLDYNQG